MNIPRVRSWKVTAVETGRIVYVDTINKDFARWIAVTEFGMWGKTLKVSVVKEKKSGRRDFGFSQLVGLDGSFCVD